ncbi:vacuolar fusion protein MON1, putative [Hepatocystis sp. ex Piliocolobus tephrosceles]|nr:vacuolar fusion protein MON1, putative [Hepatocystis sp. ex Piliocolobus tephrosceles]
MKITHDDEKDEKNIKNNINFCNSKKCNNESEKKINNVMENNDNINIHDSSVDSVTFFDVNIDDKTDDLQKEFNGYNNDNLIRKSGNTPELCVETLSSNSDDDLDNFFEDIDNKKLKGNDKFMDIKNDDIIIKGNINSKSSNSNKGKNNNTTNNNDNKNNRNVDIPKEDCEFFLKNDNVSEEIKQTHKYASSTDNDFDNFLKSSDDYEKKNTKELSLENTESSESLNDKAYLLTNEEFSIDKNMNDYKNMNKNSKINYTLAVSNSLNSITYSELVKKESDEIVQNDENIMKNKYEESSEKKKEIKENIKKIEHKYVNINSSNKILSNDKEINNVLLKNSKTDKESNIHENNVNTERSDVHINKKIEDKEIENEKIEDKEIENEKIEDKEIENEKIENEKNHKNDVNALISFDKKETSDDVKNAKDLMNKKKLHEDQSNPLWYNHKRHFFIFTYSGKPVFTRYGNEENLTSFYGTLLAIISKIESFTFSTINKDDKNNKKTNKETTKNSLKYIIGKNTKIVYLDKNVLYLVCISKVNESTNYIMNILNYMYFQIISLLTKSIDKSFQIKPSFDIRYLLDGADMLICNLISSCSKNMYSICDGFEPLPIKQDIRNKIQNLITSFKINNVLLVFLFINDKIIGISVSKYVINSMDIIILINMITSMKSFKNVESWTPICLPIYNPNLFLYAYINYIKKKVCCVYICSGASPNDFFYLSRHTSMIEAMLMSTECYDEIVKASNNCPFPLLENLDIDVIHICYYIPYLKQYYSSKLCNYEIKTIFRVYQKCDDILKDCKLPAQIYMETKHEKFYAIRTNLYHLYLTVPFYVIVNDDNINKILKVIAKYHKEIFINNIKHITT